MKVIDLRSDTVTAPSALMREAMCKAEVGDDVYGEDPTVNMLEDRVALLLGKEAGLYVSSGTQGNLIALLVHCQRGAEVILEAESHIFMYEVGGISALAGLIPRRVQGVRGALTPKDVAENIRGDNIHYPETGLICLENTHNRAGGAVIGVNETQAVRAVADEHGIPLHMDGARLFNAAVALCRPIKDLAAPCHSISLCLSKGLGAPVGSVLVGDRIFIDKARKYRKMLGGGMRQAGVIAAAGLVAIEHMVERLAEDHLNAKVLANSLGKLGFLVDVSSVETNIVMARTTNLGLDARELTSRLNSVGVRVNAMGLEVVRFVTHLDVNRDDIAEAEHRIRQVL